MDLNSSVFSLSMKKVLKLFPEKNISVMDMSRLNKEIHDRVYKEGKICIHNFDIFDVKEKIFPKDKKVRVLGVTLGNPYTSSNDFNNHISYIESTARDIIKRT
jgi:predicted aconitase